VGTGYSYVKNQDGYVTDEQTLGQEVYTLLLEFFFNLHPEYSKNPFYVFGESYAGKYVPWVTYTTLVMNNKTTTQKINIKGVGIGDGYINPYIQEYSNAPYLYRHGLINLAELESANWAVEIYRGFIDAGAYESAMELGNIIFEALIAEGGIGDVYDIRKDSDPTDPLQDQLTDYFNLAKTKKQFNATSSWQACAETPYFSLIDDFAQSSEYLFPAILKELPLMLYNGDFDFICNMDGATNVANELEWDHQQDFLHAKNQTWITQFGDTAGSYRSAYGFTQVIVNGAGHMVPFDQPKNSWDLLYRFINGGFKP